MTNHSLYPGHRSRSIFSVGRKWNTNWNNNKEENQETPIQDPVLVYHHRESSIFNLLLHPKLIKTSVAELKNTNMILEQKLLQIKNNEQKKYQTRIFNFKKTKSTLRIPIQMPPTVITLSSSIFSTFWNKTLPSFSYMNSIFQEKLSFLGGWTSCKWKVF